MVSKLYEYAFTGAGVGGGQTSPFETAQLPDKAGGFHGPRNEKLLQRSAYAPDAFLREPERDLRFSFSLAT